MRLHLADELPEQLAPPCAVPLRFLEGGKQLPVQVMVEDQAPKYRGISAEAGLRHAAHSREAVVQSRWCDPVTGACACLLAGGWTPGTGLHFTPLQCRRTPALL